MDDRVDDNPFAIRPKMPNGSRNWLRVLVLLLVCSAGAFLLHSASQRWLISRLIHQLDRHPPQVQNERLAMLAQLGSAGIPHLVDAVVGDDDRLSSAAFQVLGDMQGRWQTRIGTENGAANHALVSAIEEAAERCPRQRHSRLVALLDPIVLDAVESTASRDRELYQRAAQLLARLSEPASGRDASPRIALVAPVVPLSPQADSAFYGRDSLPPLPTSVARIQTQDGVIAAAPDREPEFPGAADLRLPGPIIQQQTTSKTDQADVSIVPTDPPMLLRAKADSTIAVDGAAAMEFVTENPLTAYDTRSVIGFVASVQPSLREAAERELRSRGFSDGDMEMAQRMMAGDSASRMSMVKELPTRADVDPRRWLVWLATDAERDVRLEAIARLGTMDDPQVRDDLRALLAGERDPTVATRLRRFLGLR